MTAGIQAFDPSGNLIVDVSTRITRVSGFLSIPAGSIGSVTVPNADQGNVWYALYIPLNSGKYYRPVMSVNGGVISWAPSTLGLPAVDLSILYGVY